MKAKKIQITTVDLLTLRDLISASLAQPNGRTEYLRDLNEELERADIVPPSEISEKVVTMNSKVRLYDLSNREEIICTLVFPKPQGLGEDEISVLAPMGTALLGMAVGDETEIQVPAGTLRLRVEEILYQPERAEKQSLAAQS